ncbi:hypothetical protein AAFF_G00180580 [Aldrovandia affinis]|uniref:Uncharacterized protein n=1 Tax=Aldrovandia affinis TaxID=143900 RepID=A0AAD7SYH3_9TELE|nr:hypothetical protein AAFF_G00180580 [Aldrovandia affinis]
MTSDSLVAYLYLGRETGSWNNTPNVNQFRMILKKILVGLTQGKLAMSCPWKERQIWSVLSPDNSGTTSNPTCSIPVRRQFDSGSHLSAS